MGQLRFGARVFVALVIVTGAALLARAALAFAIPDDPATLLPMALVIPAYAVADISGIRLHRKGLVTTLSTSIAFAGLLVFGAGTASWIAFLACFASELWNRRVWYKLAFNCTTVVILLNIAGLVFNVIDDGAVLPLTSVRNFIAIAASGSVYIGINMAMICIIVGLAEGYSAWSVWLASYKGFVFQWLTLVPIGTLVALVYEQNNIAVLLLLFPILLTHYSYKAYQQLRTDSQRTMETLATAVDRRDAYTYHHSERVSLYSEQIAQAMHLDISDTETVVAAARVHDLGKIGIESGVLLKPGALDDKEWAIMREHPTIGAEIVGQLPIYEKVRDLVAYHQERFDGKGYPAGLAGEKIPLGARIIAVADAFDAMTSDRPYRKALPHAVAVGELRKGRGSQFDPQIVDAFLLALEEAAAPVKEALPQPGVGLEQVPSHRAVG
ncbi:MAG: HD-GYP domain-containing protein [Chloroflexota bacterium]